MTFWLIAVPVVVVLAALAWWSSGRARPDRRRRSIETDVAIQEGRASGWDPRGDTGLGGF